MSGPGGPVYDGLEGLRRADPVALAAEVFVDVFAGASLTDPIRPGSQLERSSCGSPVPSPAVVVSLGRPAGWG